MPGVSIGRPDLSLSSNRRVTHWDRSTIVDLNLPVDSFGYVTYDGG